MEDIHFSQHRCTSWHHASQVSSGGNEQPPVADSSGEINTCAGGCNLRVHVIKEMFY